MNKEEFLKRLDELLQDIDAVEREEALNYYQDYFEDAGSIHEQEIISELESPEKVAQMIKEGLGVEDHHKVNDENKESYYNEKNTLILKWIIAVCVCIFGTFGLLCAVVALGVGAFRLFVDGLIAGGLICLGIGLLLVSLSYLTSLMTVSLFKYLPQAFRAMIDLGKNIYNKVVG